MGEIRNAVTMASKPLKIMYNIKMGLTKIGCMHV
jgi:hypothetical protein